MTYSEYKIIQHPVLDHKTVSQTQHIENVKHTLGDRIPLDFTYGDVNEKCDYNGECEPPETPDQYILKHLNNQIDYTPVLP